jgi:hypothetical protein
MTSSTKYYKQVKCYKKNITLLNTIDLHVLVLHNYKIHSVLIKKKDRLGERESLQTTMTGFPIKSRKRTSKG